MRLGESVNLERVVGAAKVLNGLTSFSLGDRGPARNPYSNGTKSFLTQGPEPQILT